MVFLVFCSRTGQDYTVYPTSEQTIRDASVFFHRLSRFLSVEELSVRTGSRRPLPSTADIFKTFRVYIKNCWIIYWLFWVIFSTGTRTWSPELRQWELKACASLSLPLKPFSQVRCASAARSLHSSTLCSDAATKHLLLQNGFLLEKGLPHVL